MSQESESDRTAADVSANESSAILPRVSRRGGGGGGGGGGYAGLGAIIVSLAGATGGVVVVVVLAVLAMPRIERRAACIVRRHNCSADSE